MTKPSLEQRVTDLEAAVATLTSAMCRIDTCLRDEAKTISAGCPDRRKGERRKADPRYSGLHNGTLIYSLGGFSFHDDRRSGKDRRKP